MPSQNISNEMKEELLSFLKRDRKVDLIGCYLFYIEKKYRLQPVLFPREKMIYQTPDELIQLLESQGKLWRETEIRIQFGQQSVNEQTKKIYICPFTGKVFGDNTNPNAQDAIYDWVSRCPENTEIVEGLKVKRFFVSEDPEVIKNYITKRKNPILKTVFSSAITGKLFNSKSSVIEDFKKNHIKLMSLYEVQNQNRYQIETHFLAFLQEQLTDEKISAFVEALSQHEELHPYLQGWLKEE